MPTDALFVFALCAALALLLVLERAAPHVGLMDHPGGHKGHDHPTPVVGGLAIVAALFAFCGWLDTPAPSAWLFGAIAASAVLGLIDDAYPLGAKMKLVAMMGIFAVSLHGSGNILVTLGELWPSVQVKLGVIALPFTLFAAVGVINAFNLIDGMDGLAGTVALVALTAFLVLAVQIGATEWRPFLVVMIAATSAFLLFNLRVPGRSRARLFLGDAGSLVMGLVLFWLSVDFSQRPAGVEPMVMVWLLALPMLDTVATMTLRIREGVSIFTPGHDHFHHLLRAHGMSVERVVLLAAALSVASAAAGISMWRAGAAEWVSLLAFLGVTVAYVRLHLRAWFKLGRGRRDVRQSKFEPGRVGGD